ncbi:MAG: GNAT family N-acetyltransferase [Myxococcales bacterium]|jgi:GNAT superfamily N-acetyltransferase|nr:MAG: GNAT family N-acetyltransferase [Myxococcales bacterium]
MIVREATPDDVAFVVEAIRGLAEYEKLEHECAARVGMLERHVFGELRYAEILIGEIDGERAGYALFFHTYSTFLTRPGIYLEDLFVRPADRRRGLGRALLARVAGLAVERDCGRLEWAVLDWNEPAIAFYRSLGAGPLEDWTTFRLTGEALARLGG